MRRRLFNFISALSLLLFLALCVLWARTYRHSYDCLYVSPTRENRVQSLRVYFVRGIVRIHAGQTVLSSGGGEALFEEDLASWRGKNSRGWGYTSGKAPTASETPRDGNGPWTFKYVPITDTHRRDDSRTTGILKETNGYLWFPLWVAALAFAVLPTLWLSGRWQTRRRRRAGHCPSCGYDLRATPGRCPECGAACKAANPAGVSPAAGN